VDVGQLSGWADGRTTDFRSNFLALARCGNGFTECSRQILNGHAAPSDYVSTCGCVGIVKGITRKGNHGTNGPDAPP
jgi:hypothetical protein